MKSLNKVVVDPTLREALEYVFSHMAALSVFVAAKLASGVGSPSTQRSRSVGRGCRPPLWGPSTRQHTRSSRFTVLLVPRYAHKSLAVLTMLPAQQMVSKSDGTWPRVELAHSAGLSYQSRDSLMHQSVVMRPDGTAVVIDEDIVARGGGMVRRCYDLREMGLS